VAEVAEALKEIKEQMVFVGGAVVSLYTDDPASDEIRPTKDIDLTLNVVNLGHWENLQERLAQIGFYPDPYGQSICSYKYKNIPVDIMSTDDGPLGPSNKWYKVGFKNLWTVKAKDQEIQILSAPCFLATKFEAFNNRGRDYRTSHDIEDIIYVLDNRTTIVQEVLESEESILPFLREQFGHIKNKGLLEETLLAHIHPLMQEERMELVIEKINHILIT
jgi:predicted nucleotidyltransferase